MSLRSSFLLAALLSLPLALTPALADDLPLAKTDIVSQKTVTLDPAPWNYVPQAKIETSTDQPIKLPPAGANRETYSDVVPGALTTIPLQFHYDLDHKNNKPVVQFILRMINLKTGVVAPDCRLPPDWLAQDLSPDASRAVLVANRSLPSAAGEIQIAELQGETAKPLLHFMPYQTEDAHERNITWARMPDNHHALTLNEGAGHERRVICWQIDTDSAKGVWSFTVPHSLRGDPLLTPDGKYLILIEERGAWFLDVATGSVAGVIADPMTYSSFDIANLQCAVRPDGKMFARSTQPHVKIYSLEGEPRLIADVFMPPKLKVDSISWTNDDFLMVNHRYLVDVKKGLIVWQYSGAGGGPGDMTALFPAAGKSWVVSVDHFRVTAVNSFILPDEEAKKAVAALDLDQIMIIKPGMQVTLNVDLPDAQAAGEVKAHFESELKKNNMTIADGQLLKLHVTIADTKSKDVQYRDIGGPTHGHTSNTSVTNKEMTVAYELDGKEVWKVVQYTNAPLILQVKPGQSTEAAIKERQAGEWKQLVTVNLPRYVPAPRDPPGFGQTALDIDRKK